VPYRAVPFRSFAGGLNLRDQPDVVEPSQAVDLRNVLFTEYGGVRSRDGYGRLTAAPLTNRGDSLSAFYRTDGTRHLLVGCGTRLEALSASGSVLASVTGLAGGPYTFARVGTPNGELAYAGNGTDTLRRWDGTAWASPSATVDGAGGAAMPRARVLAVDNDSNRLVCADFAGTTGGPGGSVSSPSHVYFSEPGNPEAYKTANYVQLSPGDGERIRAAVSWRGQVFVFKETKFYRFWGETARSDGSVIFNYTAVESGVGAVGPLAVCAARDGVYFVSRTGVYRTTGDTPQLVSHLVDGIFTGRAPVFYSGGVLNQSQAQLVSVTSHEERVYVAFPSGASTFCDRVLVLDPRFGWWALYTMPAAAVASFRVGARAELVFPYSTGANHVGRHSASYVADDGAPIFSFWQSGWFDYGSPAVKTIREAKVWGFGRVKVSIGRDFMSGTGESVATLAVGTDKWADGTDAADKWADGTTSADTWGAGTTLSPALVRAAVRGTVFSFKILNYDAQPWGVNRVALHLREQRVPSVLEADVR
jgi:hypothetical protein